jgi:hypothetical protein
MFVSGFCGHLKGYKNVSRVHKLKSHFTHKTKSPWPLHYKHSHWWRRRSQSEFASHYAWGTNWACECKMDVKSTWISTRHQMDQISWSLRLLLGGSPNTKPGDHDTPTAHNRWFILFYHVWGPTWIEFIEIVFGWGPGHIWLHTTLEGPWAHIWFLRRCVGTSISLICLVNATFLMWWVCHKKAVQVRHYYSHNLRQLGKPLHYQATRDSPNTSPSTKINSNESMVELSDWGNFWA